MIQMTDDIKKDLDVFIKHFKHENMYLKREKFGYDSMSEFLQKVKDKILHMEARDVMTKEALKEFPHPNKPTILKIHFSDIEPKNEPQISKFDGNEYVTLKVWNKAIDKITKLLEEKYKVLPEQTCDHVWMDYMNDLNIKHCTKCTAVLDELDIPPRIHDSVKEFQESDANKGRLEPPFEMIDELVADMPGWELQLCKKHTVQIFRFDKKEYVKHDAYQSVMQDINELLKEKMI